MLKRFLILSFIVFNLNFSFQQNLTSFSVSDYEAFKKYFLDSNTLGFQPNDSNNSSNILYSKFIDDYKFSRNKRSFTKSSFFEDDLNELNEVFGVLRLTQIYNVGNVCNFGKQLISFKTINVYDHLYTVCLTNSQLIVGELKENDKYSQSFKWVFLIEYRGSNFRKLEYFLNNKQIIFLIAKSGTGMPFIKYDIYSNKLIELEQQAISFDPTTINIWQPKSWKPMHQSPEYLKPGKTWNLAVANSFESNNEVVYEERKKRDLDETSTDQFEAITDTPIDLENEIQVNKNNSSYYKKSLSSYYNKPKSFSSTLTLFYFDTKSNYFDEYDKISTYFVKDICTFSINDYDYMVVINYKAAIDQHQVDSEIFKLDLHEGSWKSIQKIRTYGAVACDFFKIETQDKTNENEYFLAIANNHDIDDKGNKIYAVNTVIYHFHFDQFVPFQCLKTNGATSLKFIQKGKKNNLKLDTNFQKIEDMETSQSQKLTLIVASIDGVSFYQYNGWKFFLSSVRIVNHGMPYTNNPSYKYNLNDKTQLINFYLKNDNNLFNFDFKEKNYFLTSNMQNLKEPNLFMLGYSQENYLKNWYNSNFNWCMNLKNFLYNQNLMTFNYLNKVLNQTFMVNQNQPIFLNNLVFNKKVSIARLSSPLVVDVVNQKNYNYTLVKSLLKLDEELNRIDLEEKIIHNLIYRSLKLRSSQPQILTERVFFDSMSVNCLNKVRCKFSLIETFDLNRENIYNLNKRIIRINSRNVVGIENISFNKIYCRNKVSAARINSFRTQDFINKNENIIFHQNIYFDNDVFVNNLQVLKTLNNKVFKSDNILLNRKNQFIPVPIFMENLLVNGNLIIDGQINNFGNFWELINSIVTRFSNVTIKSEKRFTNSMVVSKLVMTERSTFNGFNLIDFYDNLIWIDSNNLIKVPVNLTNLIIQGNLNVGRLINGINLLEDFVVANRTNLIKSSVVFKMPVDTYYLNVSKSLNKMPVLYSNLDLLTKNLPQKIFSTKYVSSNLYSKRDSHVQGFINGRKLSQFAHDLKSKAKNNYFDGLVSINGDATFLKDLFVTNEVNKINLGRLLKNALRTDEPVINGFREIHFNLVETSNVNAKKINYLEIEKDFMFKNIPQVVYGFKNFVNGLHLQNNFNVTNLNGINLAKEKLDEDSLLRDVSQKITGHKVIKGDLHVENLLTNNINNINLNKLLTLSKDGFMSGLINFKNDVIFDSDLIVKKANDLNFVNDHLIQDFIHNSLRYTMPQIVLGNKSFRKITIPKLFNLKINKINNVVLQRLFSSILYKDSSRQIINGKKVFQGYLRTKSIKFDSSWDEIGRTQFLNDFVINGRDNYINGNLTINGFANFEKVFMIKKNIVNNIYLPSFFNTFIPLDSPTLLKGKLNFSAVDFLNNIQLRGLLNNLDVSKDFLLSQNNPKNSLIFGKKAFDNIFVNNVLIKSDLLNHISLKRLFANTIRTYSNENIQIESPTIVHGNVIANELNVNNKINNIDLESLKRNVVLNSQNKQSTIIGGRKHFDVLVLEGPSLIMNYGNFSGINLKLLEKNYFSLTKPQVIKDALVFNRSLNIDHLKVKGNLEVNLINNLRLQELFYNSLKSTGQQVLNSEIHFTGKIIFNKNIMIANDSINNIQLNRDIMLRNRPVNIVYCHKKFFNDVDFNEIHTKNIRPLPNFISLDNNKRFNFVELLNISVFNDGKFYDMQGLKHFRRLVVDDIELKGKLNGIDFNQRSLFVNNPNLQHIIKGNKNLKGPVHIKSSLKVHKNINYRNFNEFINDLILKGRGENIIVGEKLVYGNLNVKNLNVLGLIHGHNVSKLSYDVFKPKLNPRYTTHSTINLNKNLNRINNLLQKY